MHPIVTENPGYAEIVAQQEKHEAASRKFTERIQKAEAEYAAAQGKYQAAVRQATLDGEALPAPPAAPAPVGDPMVLWDRAQQLRDAERKYLADNAETLLGQLAVRLEDVMSNEAKPYVEQLALIAAEVREVLASVSAVRIAAGVRTETVEYPNFGVVDLASAVATGADLLVAPPRTNELIALSFR